MGSMRITLKPDIYTVGKGAIAENQKKHGWFADTYDYARNPLAILVAKGNPKHIENLQDLGRVDVRASMSDLACDGIARQIEASYRKVDGEALDKTIMQTKVKDDTSFFTRIHHDNRRCAFLGASRTRRQCGRPRRTSSSRSCIARSRDRDPSGTERGGDLSGRKNEERTARAGGGLLGLGLLIMAARRRAADGNRAIV